MLSPFRLRGPIDRNSNMNLEDVRRVKQALVKIGIMEIPEYGLTPYPDQLMFDGIEDFQSRRGLQVDGVMKPDGPTLRRMNETLNARRKKVGQPLKPRTVVLGLSDEVGDRRKNRSHDVFSARQALNWAGHLPMNSSGASSDLANAIKGFQKASGLKQDGFLRPHGETEKMLNEALAGTLDDIRRGADLTDGSPADRTKGRIQQAFAWTAIPPIVLKIAEYFGIAVLAALAWWQSMSAAEKDRIRRQVTGDGPSDDGGNRDECDRLLFDVDIPTCNAVGEGRGKQAAQRCYASANERYAACLRGVPLDRLPPLDVWNN